MVPARLVPHCPFGQTPSSRAAARGRKRHFMMARMPEMSRRAVLRLGSGAAAGALGAYAMDRLLPGRTAVATPVVMTGTGIPLAPHPPLEPAPAPTMATGSFVSAARGGVATNWAI